MPCLDQALHRRRRPTLDAKAQFGRIDAPDSRLSDHLHVLVPDRSGRTSARRTASPFAKTRRSLARHRVGWPGRHSRDHPSLPAQQFCPAEGCLQAPNVLRSETRDVAKGHDDCRTYPDSRTRAHGRQEFVERRTLSRCDSTRTRPAPHCGPTPSPRATESEKARRPGAWTMNESAVRGKWTCMAR